jgi:hypothetical protein
MGLFNRRVTAPAMGQAPVKAAAGASQVGSFINYTTSFTLERALSVPTIARSVALISSMIGTLELKQFTRRWNGDEYDRVYLPQETWMDRPDPKVTRNFIMSNTVQDMMLYGRAFWYVTTRYSNGFPASFTWLPNANVSTPNQQGPQFFGMPDTIEFNGLDLDVNNVVTFLSPFQGIVYSGARHINMAVHFDQAADKYASLETVPGYLQQRGGETMSGSELSELASSWAAARKANAIGALNDLAEFVEYKKDPSEVVADMRRFEALELSRLCNIPAYLVSAPVEGASFTYQNATQARQDLYLFGARPFIDAIEETLSLDTILPRGRYVEFDIDEYLEENAMTELPGAPSAPEGDDQDDSL